MKRNRASHSGAQGAKGVEGVRKGIRKDRGERGCTGDEYREEGMLGYVSLQYQ